MPSGVEHVAHEERHDDAHRNLKGVRKAAQCREPLRAEEVGDERVLQHQPSRVADAECEEERDEEPPALGRDEREEAKADAFQRDGEHVGPLSSEAVAEPAHDPPQRDGGEPVRCRHDADERERETGSHEVRDLEDDPDKLCRRPRCETEREQIEGRHAHRVRDFDAAGVA